MNRVIGLCNTLITAAYFNGTCWWQLLAPFPQRLRRCTYDEGQFLYAYRRTHIVDRSQGEKYRDEIVFCQRRLIWEEPRTRRQLTSRNKGDQVGQHILKMHRAPHTAAPYAWQCLHQWPNQSIRIEHRIKLPLSVVKYTLIDFLETTQFISMFRFFFFFL